MPVRAVSSKKRHKRPGRSPVRAAASCLYRQANALSFTKPNDKEKDACGRRQSETHAQQFARGVTAGRIIGHRKGTGLRRGFRRRFVILQHNASVIFHQEKILRPSRPETHCQCLNHTENAGGALGRKREEKAEEERTRAGAGTTDTNPYGGTAPANEQTSAKQESSAAALMSVRGFTAVIPAA